MGEADGSWWPAGVGAEEVAQLEALLGVYYRHIATDDIDNSEPQDLLGALIALEADDPDAAPLMENWGVAKIEDFSWKSLIDNYACTECARCTTYCPAFATEKKRIQRMNRFV